MARTKSLAAVVAIGAILALPSVAVAKPEKADNPRRGLDSLNQPVVQRTDYLLDLADNGGLSDADLGRLDSWFDSLGLGYGDHVSVDQGTGAGRQDVARVAAAYGLLMSQTAPVLEGDIPAGAVRVVVSRTTASVPNCPNFDKERGPSSTSSNYGCAVNSNLAAMIADPNHLVLGQVGSVTGDSSTSTKAIRVWRQTEPTGAKGLTNVSTSGRGN
jgi:pilus assembly protein CpaD